jgi:[NiFe] hydrogenase large subunit
MGAQFQHDHIVHFYHLHALDWVDIVSAISADPKKTAVLSDNVSNAPWGGTVYFKSVQDRLKTFVGSGQLGPFSNAYWGHSAYKLPPEANLMAAAHYIEAIRLQAKAARMHAIFGGKNPHPQSLTVGGVTCVRDLTADRIAEFLYVTKETQDFIKNVYIPDLLAVASFYKDWGAIGGTSNFLAWGEFPETLDEPASLYMPRGVIMKRNLAGVKMAHQEKVSEHVARSWYEGKADRHPYEGETKPLQEDPQYRPGDGKYSWFKAPRYEGEPCEVGPLTRVLVAYAKGHPDIKPIVDHVLKTLGVGAGALFSTLGRTAARGIEALAIGERNQKWVMELIENIKSGDTTTYTPYEMPDSAMGVGLNDVPRGSLGHWVQIEDKKIKNYQYVVPSTWNLGPRDMNGKMGPVEEALIGTPVADPKKPLEILRTVHSFDPCVACGVHVIDPDSNEVYKIRAI